MIISNAISKLNAVLISNIAINHLDQFRYEFLYGFIYKYKGIITNLAILLEFLKFFRGVFLQCLCMHVLLLRSINIVYVYLID